MSKIFSAIVISFFAIFITNIAWIVITIILVMTTGFESVLHYRGFIQSVATSNFLKWILLVDAIWIVSFFIYLFSRKKYRIETERHFLQYDPIENPRICVIIPAYNEQDSIQQVVNDYRDHKYVKEIIVIDNHSDDKTVELARQSGAKVITKNENRGYAHSIVIGLKEALKTDSNIIAITEADKTFSSYDLDKMVPYLAHCDVVNGSRQVQILTEKGNLRESAIHIWGNYFLSKLLQLKYLNFTHLGIVNLSDIGCMSRIFRREAVESIQNQFTFPGTDIPIGGVAFVVFLTMKCLENDFRIIEVPVTYSKRSGRSKIGSESKLKNLKGGLLDLYLILKY